VKDFRFDSVFLIKPPSYAGNERFTMGAIALFIVLAVVMYVTRKVDWYARDSG